MSKHTIRTGLLPVNKTSRLKIPKKVTDSMIQKRMLKISTLRKCRAPSPNDGVLYDGDRIVALNQYSMLIIRSSPVTVSEPFVLDSKGNTLGIEDYINYNQVVPNMLNGLDNEVYSVLEMLSRTMSAKQYRIRGEHYSYIDRFPTLMFMPSKAVVNTMVLHPILEAIMLYDTMVRIYFAPTKIIMEGVFATNKLLGIIALERIAEVNYTIKPSDY